MTLNVNLQAGSNEDRALKRQLAARSCEELYETADAGYLLRSIFSAAQPHLYLFRYERSKPHTFVTLISRSWAMTCTTNLVRTWQ